MRSIFGSTLIMALGNTFESASITTFGRTLRSTFGNTFEVCLPLFKEAKIANWCWGFVDGKSGTKWDWGTKSSTVGSAVPIPKNDPSKASHDPKLWFHDVLHPDGTPYIQTEVNFIKSVMEK